MRGRSYTPSPPRGGYGRRGRSPSPRGRHGGGRGRDDGPTSLLVRNLRHDCRPEDLRRPFGQFGPLKDIYLPRDYYSGKKPTDMRQRERGGGRGRAYDRRRSPPPYSRSSRYSRSPPPRSPPPRYGRSRSRSQEYNSPSPKRRQYSRSLSPQDKKHARERSYSRSPAYNNSRSRSRSPIQARGQSRSPPRDKKPIEPEVDRSPSQ